MILDEVIERYTSNAEYERTHGSLQGCMDFKQLAEWLRELKQLRQAVEDIRREIEQLMYKPATNGGQIAQNLAYENCLGIIDKHLKEGEE